MFTQDPDMSTSLCVGISVSNVCRGPALGKKADDSLYSIQYRAGGRGQMLLSVYEPQSDDRADTQILTQTPPLHGGTGRF